MFLGCSGTTSLGGRAYPFCCDVLGPRAWLRRKARCPAVPRFRASSLAALVRDGPLLHPSKGWPLAASC